MSHNQQYFQEGQAAYIIDPTAQNPYPEDSAAEWSWDAGFAHAWWTDHEDEL